MTRMAMVLNLHPEKVEIYKELHRKVWPDVLDMIKQCNISNYSIFLREPENILFGVWDYNGVSFEADAQKMANDPKTQEWWALCKPCQVPLQSHKHDEWWCMMEEVFYQK